MGGAPPETVGGLNERQDGLTDVIRKIRPCGGDRLKILRKRAVRQWGATSGATP